MTADEKRQMKDFEMSARQVLALCQKLKGERVRLLESLEKAKQDVGDLRRQLEVARQDYANLKTAKMLEISDSDIRNARQRISHLVREVNKCIGMLSTEF